jgi:F-box protein 11
MPADERSLSEGKTIAGKLLPTNVNDPVSIGGENTRTDKPGSHKPSDPMQVREFSDKFRVERLIGQGGMGEVYLAFDLQLNRHVAIKAILGQSVNSEAALQRFMTEAQAIAKIIHTHIVNIYELGQDKIGPYLVLEYVSGGSLADKLKSGPLSLERSIEITCQLCDGLAKVHAAGIIHRDIKPANILLTPEGDPKLTDFGLARHEYTDTGLTTTGAMIGTLGFMSPEQTNSSQVDARSDIYSLGATLYQMVTAKNPRVMNFNHVPNAIRDVLHKATEEIVEDRFQSVIDFRDALRGHRVVISVYDFNEGECPGCLTKNDPTRKFCKKCANSLLALCLSCSESIRVWEEVCDHCGKKQSLFIAKMKEKMLATQLEAEDLLSNYDFDKALSLATQLKDQSDPRLRQFKTWVELFVTKVETEQNKAYEYISSLMTEALTYEKSYDYQAALVILEQVHPNLRDLVISVVYDEAYEYQVALIVLKKVIVSANKILMRVQAEIRYLNERRSKMEKISIEVESLIKEFRFDEAIDLLKPFANDSDPRLTDLKMQAESLIAKQVVSSLVVAADGSGDYMTIIEALEVIPYRGTIKVKPGIYKERLIINKPVILEGYGSHDEIIIGCIELNTTFAVIRGLSFNGELDDILENDYESIVFISQGEPRLEDCGISGKGTGIIIKGKGTNPTVRRCEIHDCGEAISVSDYGSGLIEDCDIYEMEGDGISISTGGNPIIKKSKIHNVEKVGIHTCKNGTGKIEDCEMYENKFGVAIRTGGNPIIKNCKIHNGEFYGIYIFDNGIGAIENCEIYENKLSAVAIQTGGNPSIKKCKIHNGEQTGILVYENGIGTIEDCEIYENKKSGLTIETGGNPSIKKCKIHNCEQSGIYVKENGIGTIEGCEIYENKFSGVFIKTGGNPSIKKCKIHNGETNGIHVDENGIGAIEGCEIFENKSSGVRIRTGGNPSIKKCKIHNGKSVGILVDENGIGTIEDCEIYENKLSGISIQTGGNPSIKKCKIHNGETNGIRVYENGIGTIEDCEIYENNLYGIQIFSNGSPTILKCVISSHSSYAAIYGDSTSDGIIKDCDLSNNKLAISLESCSRIIQKNNKINA